MKQTNSTELLGFLKFDGSGAGVGVGMLRRNAKYLTPDTHSI